MTTEWRPITTAPMDGTFVDIWAKWDSRHSGQRWCDAHYDADYHDEKTGAWIVQCTTGEGPLSKDWEITHWMLSPGPPND